MLRHRLVKGQFIVLDSGRIFLWVSGIDSIDTCSFQHDIGLDLKSPESRAGISSEERAAGPAGDQSHAPLLQHLDGVVTVIVAYKRFHRSG